MLVCQTISRDYVFNPILLKNLLAIHLLHLYSRPPSKIYEPAKLKRSHAEHLRFARQHLSFHLLVLEVPSMDFLCGYRLERLVLTDIKDSIKGSIFL